MSIRVDLISFIACIIVCIDQTFLLNLGSYFGHVGLRGFMTLADGGHLEQKKKKSKRPGCQCWYPRGTDEALNLSRHTSKAKLLESVTCR